MNGTIHHLTICGYDCLLYLPQDYFASDLNYPVVYINGGDGIYDIVSGIEPHFGVDCEEMLILSIQSGNWGYDYTPWPAPALTKKDEPFGGGAPKYLQFLSGTIKPFIDTNYRTNPEPENTALLGYSLGGLAALYALYTCGTFGKIGSLSGSLWYKGWIDFMDSKKPVNPCSKVYISLGKSEEHSRNPQMAKVGDYTRTTAEIVSQQLQCTENVKLDWNNGGHFAEIPERYQRAILWLMQTKESYLGLQ